MADQADALDRLITASPATSAPRDVRLARQGEACRADDVVLGSCPRPKSSTTSLPIKVNEGGHMSIQCRDGTRYKDGGPRYLVRSPGQPSHVFLRKADATADEVQVRQAQLGAHAPGTPSGIGWPST